MLDGLRLIHPCPQKIGICSWVFLGFCVGRIALCQWEAWESLFSFGGLFTELTLTLSAFLVI